MFLNYKAHNGSRRSTLYAVNTKCRLSHPIRNTHEFRLLKQRLYYLRGQYISFRNDVKIFESETPVIVRSVLRNCGRIRAGVNHRPGVVNQQAVKRPKPRNAFSAAKLPVKHHKRGIKLRALRNSFINRALAERFKKLIAHVKRKRGRATGKLVLEICSEPVKSQVCAFLAHARGKPGFRPYG